jgi:hypothetical protein
MLIFTAYVFSPESAEGSIQVSLASPAGAYGVRELATQRILSTASGLALAENDDGQFQVELADPAAGTLYEYWLKVQDQNAAFYVWSGICSLESQEYQSDSASESEEDEEPVRSLRLRCEQSPVNRFGSRRGDSVRLRVTVLTAVGMPAEIFGFGDREFDDESADDARDFRFITSPLDENIYPVDAPDPDQSPPFYRRSSLDILVPNPAAASRVWERIKVEADNLIASYNRRDTIVAADETTIT